MILSYGHFGLSRFFVIDAFFILFGLHFGMALRGFHGSGP